jgi:hypothetical protein
MKKAFHLIKTWDIIITLSLVFISFIPVTIFSYQQAKVEAQSDSIEYVAVISSKNKELDRITLTGHKGTEIFNFPEIECNPNVVEVKDEEIRIQSSTCPEQICITTGYISEPGPAIVCLPHMVIITIEAVGSQTDDPIIST